MRLARARPGNLADLAGPDGRDGLQGLRGVDEILEIAGEDAGGLRDVEDLLRLGGVARERLRAEGRLAVPRTELDRLEVQVVRQPDHDGVRRRVGDRRLEIGRVLGDVVRGGERLRALGRPRVDDRDTVTSALAVQRARVEEPDQPGAEHRHSVTVHWSSRLLP